MTSPAWLSRLLLAIGGVCFLFAAVTAIGGNVMSAPAVAWSFGGWSAVAFGLAARA